MTSVIIAAGTLDHFVAGLAIGLLVGHLLAPRLWTWLVWREWVDARSRHASEAKLGRELLERMARRPGPDDMSAANGRSDPS